MLKGRSSLDCTDLVSPKAYERNDQIIIKYFQQILKRLKQKIPVVLFVFNMENLKTVRYYTFLKKH